MATRVGLALGGTGAACGRAYTVLRETHMTAVVCEPAVEGDEVAIARLAATPMVTADAVLRRDPRRARAAPRHLSQLSRSVQPVRSAAASVISR